MTEIFGIDPVDEPYYRQGIRREQALTRQAQTGDAEQSRVQAVMVVQPPVGMFRGTCIRLASDTDYPYCFSLRFDRPADPASPQDFAVQINGGSEFNFSESATVADVVSAFPTEWRPLIKVTGGEVVLDDDSIVHTGHFLIGFSSYPTDFEAVDGTLKPVLFLADDIPRECTSLNPDSSTEPVRSGDLLNAAIVAGIGYSLLKIASDTSGPLVVLAERLAAATNRFDDDNLPSATAHHVSETFDENGVKTGTSIDLDRPIKLFNRGRGIEYAGDTLGYYKLLLGKLQFIPLECGPVGSGETESFEWTDESDLPDRV